MLTIPYGSWLIPALCRRSVKPRTVNGGDGQGGRAGGRSLSTVQGVLGRNRHQAHCLLHKTLLGAPSEGCIQEEGKGCDIPCDHLSG